MSDSSHKPLPLSDADGRLLTALARHSIAAKLGIKPDQFAKKALPAGLDQAVFKQLRGTFVTLKKAGSLRGCIGTLNATESLVDGIRSNAVNAAFNDMRFKPLGATEFPEIAIEISILTPLEPMSYKDADDLCRKLKPHYHGVMVRRGAACATFLPQVWEQLPAPETFLSQLCLKAGLAADAWRCQPLEVLIYTVQHFEE